MAEYSDSEIKKIVEELLCVVDPEVNNGLSNMRYIRLLNNISRIVDAGNPAIYINKKGAQKRVLLFVNNQDINNVNGSGPLKAEQGNTIVVAPGALKQKPTIYGILLHEMAHAWLDTGVAVNDEANAYKFEIQWVCTLASKSGHPFSKEMKDGLASYFKEREKQSGWPTEHLEWTKSRLNL